MSKLVNILFFLFLPSFALQAQLFYENFTYPINSNLVSNSWAEHSGNGSNPISTQGGLSFFGINSPTSAARLNGGGQDVNRSFSGVNTGTIYTRLLVDVESASTDGDYFFHMGPAELGTAFRARVFVKSEAGKVKFGISKSSSNPNYTSQEYELDKVYLLIVKYTFNQGSNTDDGVELAIISSQTELNKENFTISAAGGETDANNIGTVAMRQGSSGRAPSLVIDEILVSDSWQNATTLKTVQALTLNFPTDMYAYNQTCREQAIFEGRLVANSQGNNLNLWSLDSDKISLSKDKINWGNQLSFKSATGTYSESVFIKYNGILNIEKQSVFLKIDDFEAKELLDEQIDFRQISLQSDCSMSINSFKNLQDNGQARISGTVTASAREFGSFNYIQDDNGGIRVNGDFGWQIGDSVSILGQKGILNQEVLVVKDTCCDAFESIQLRGQGTQKIYQTTVKNIENHQGQLVQISNAIINDKRFVFLPNTNENINDGTGALETRIWSATDIDGLNKPQSSSTWQGVVGRYRDNIQLYPRNVADISGLSVYDFPPNVNPEETFDLAAWNVEWFGSAGNGPRDDEQQLLNVGQTLREIDADAIVLTEVTSLGYFDRLLSSLGDYEGKCSPAVSGGVSDGEVQRVCLVYKKDLVRLIEVRPLLSGTAPISNYPESFDRFWASGRLPALFVCDVSIKNVQKRLHIVGIHARANRSNTDERELVYQMRKKDLEVLKDSLDLHFSAASIIMAGDYNDDLDESVVFGIQESSYKPFVDDKENWNMVSKSLSDKGYKSFIGFENVIDHVGISNELSSSYIPSSVFLGLPFLNIADYANTTSDHLPIVARFKFNESDPITSTELLEVDSIVVFPNPSSGEFNIKIASDVKFETMLFDQKGTLIHDSKGYKDQIEKKLRRQLQKSGQGLYLLKLIIGNEVKTYKIVNQL